MSQNVTGNSALTRAQARRSRRQAIAAELVSGGFLKAGQIADVVGIDRRTLSRWKRSQAFWEVVNAHRLEYQERMRDEFDRQLLVSDIGSILRNDTRHGVYRESLNRDIAAYENRHRNEFHRGRRRRVEDGRTNPHT